MHPVYALSSHSVDEAIFHVSSVLQVPVLILALLALALVIFELGSFAVELRGRRRRRFSRLAAAAEQARAKLDAADRDGAAAAVTDVARSSAMAGTLTFIMQQVGRPGADHQLNKALADFDFDAQRRLARTRLLVRAGPALGLMGTLIPLSPALTGLANGNTGALTQNLRIAFSVTVVGLLIGAVAFGLSLTRDRMYGQDLSDLEYLAAVISDPRPVVAPPPTVVTPPPTVVAPPPTVVTTPPTVVTTPPTVVTTPPTVVATPPTVVAPPPTLPAAANHPPAGQLPASQRPASPA